MAVIIDINDISTVRLNYVDANGNAAFNILHYRLREVSVPGGGLFAGEDSTAVLPELAKAAFDKLKVGWANLANNTISMLGATAQSVHPAPRSAQYHWSALVPAVGTIEDEALPLQDTPTILKRSAFGQRWGMGRLFVVGLPESSQNLGILTVGAMTTLNDWCEDLSEEVSFLVNGNTFFYRPTLFSPTSGEGGVPRTTAIVSINPSDTILKTQRRRRPGKGI